MGASFAGGAWEAGDEAGGVGSEREASASAPSFAASALASEASAVAPWQAAAPASSC